MWNLNWTMAVSLRRFGKAKVFLNYKKGGIVLSQIAIEKLLNDFSQTTEDIFSMEELKKKLYLGKQLKIKYGVDVTSPFLHIGHAVVGYTLSCLLKLNRAKVTLVGKDKKKANVLFCNFDYFVLFDDSISSYFHNRFDFVFETVGRRQEETLSMAIKCVRPKGSIIVLGVFEPNYQMGISVRDLFIKEARLVGSNAYTQKELVNAIKLLEEHHHLFETFVTHKVPFSKLKEGIN